MPRMHSLTDRLTNAMHTSALQSHRTQAEDRLESGQMPCMHSLADGLTNASSKSLGSHVAPVKQSSSRRRSLESRRSSLDRRGSRYSLRVVFYHSTNALPVFMVVWVKYKQAAINTHEDVWSHILNICTSAVGTLPVDNLHSAGCKPP